MNGPLAAETPSSGIGLSVIIVSWNTREILRECLERIPAAAEGLAFETIVIDNGSSDGSARMVREEFPGARVIENDENTGFAAATNQGIRESSGEYIALVNSDIMTPPGSLAHFVRYLENSPGVAAVGPQLVGRSGHLQYSGGYAPSPASAFSQLSGLQAVLGGRSRGMFVRSRSTRKPMPVDWIGGACMVTRRSVIDEVGMLDDEHFMYAEDVEYGVRMRQAGWKLHLLPWIRVVHYGGASSTGSPEARLLWMGGLFRVAAGQLGFPRFNIFGLLMSMAYFIRYLLVTLARLIPLTGHMMDDEVARNEDMRLYAVTSLRLGLHGPGYAMEYSSRLEEKCRARPAGDKAEKERAT